MNFKDLCELDASEIINECNKEQINELYGQYTIRIQLLDGDKVIDQQEHDIAGDEAVWNKYQQLNQQFVQEESVIAEEVLYENLEKMFGNLGIHIKDYFTRLQHPKLEQEAPHGGLTKHSASDLANLVLHFAKNNPQLKRLGIAIKLAKEHSSSPQEFLANIKGLAYNAQQYQESYVEEGSWSVIDKATGNVRNRTPEEIQKEVEAIKEELRQIPEKKPYVLLQNEMRSNRISIPALRQFIEFKL